MGMRTLARIGFMFVLATGSLAAAQSATQTTLTAETRDVNGHTVVTFSTRVLDADGAPVSGVVSLVEKGKSLSSAALDAKGATQIELDTLTAGDHNITAIFNGDSAHATSTSEAVSVHPLVTGTPDFSLAIAPTSLSVNVGAAGTTQATITPVNGFTGFISLSCAGPAGATTLPTGVTCTFAPANLQVSAPTTANPSGAVSAQLSIQTATGQALNKAPAHGNSEPLVLAILLPGILGLGILGRKRKLFGRLALVLLIGGVTLVGTTGCNPRYYYLNHGPHFGGTAPGSYTIQVIAQTSNGVTASGHSVNLALTVN